LTKDAPEGGILAAVDFLSALAAALPTPPAPGKGPPSNEPPAGMAVAHFAALMLQVDPQKGGPKPAVPLPGESGSSSGLAGSDGASGAQQLAPVAPDAAAPHSLPPALPATIAAAVITGVPAIVPAGDEQPAAGGPKVTAVPGHLEAEAADRPDASPAQASVAETGPGPGQSRPLPVPDLAVPPADTGRNDPPPAALQGDTASTGGGAMASTPAVALDAGIATPRGPAASEAVLARDTGETSGAAVVPAAVGPASDASGPVAGRGTPLGGDQIADEKVAVEQEPAVAPGKGTDGDDQGLPQDEPASPDGPVGSQLRGTESGARPQPSGDPQGARLPQVSTLHGAAPGLQPTAGVSADAVHLIARAPDSVAGVEAGPAAATRQVALQITKALDQDRTEIRIRLDPPELGEVDIQLEFRDLRLTASINAERPDTLDLLQRDARSLARALREAGLELADADLSFAHHGRNERSDAGPYAQRSINLPDGLAAAARLQDLPPALAGRGGFVSLSDGRMDLRV
jgi:hypothetical protein